MQGPKLGFGMIGLQDGCGIPPTIRCHGLDQTREGSDRVLLVMVHHRPLGSEVGSVLVDGGLEVRTHTLRGAGARRSRREGSVCSGRP